MLAPLKIITAPKRLLLDSHVVPSGAYSFRRLLTSYKANKALNIIRASDSATIDIGFTSNGKPDIATLTAFLSGTTGKIVTWYDQSGNGRDLTQATDANRPTIALANLGIWPCLQMNDASISLSAAANITPATGVMSFAAVANRVSGTGGVTLAKETGGANSNRFQTQAGTANAWQLVANGSVTFVRSATDNAWHSGIAVINGASSVITIDAVTTTGSATGSTIAGAPGVGAGVAGTNVSLLESMFWDNAALSTAERTYLTNNQRNFWRF